MKLSSKKVTVSTIFTLNSAKIEEIVNCWQEAWQADNELKAIIPSEAWNVEAVLWLESNQQKEQAIDCSFWKRLTKLPLTKSHWNALLLQLDSALEHCHVEIKQQEKIIESALHIQQRYFFSKKTEHSSNEFVVFQNNTLEDTTTQTTRGNGKLTIMNEEKSMNERI